MSNLLRANFFRLWRSKAFWGCAAAAFAAVAAAVCFDFFASPNASTRNWDQTMIGFFSVPLFTAAAFAAVFLGTEHAENTVRNKLAVGKTRLRVYFANLITVTAGGLIITAAGQLAPSAVALFSGGDCIGAGAKSFAAGIAVCVCAVIGACAFFTLVGMLVTRRSAAVVLALCAMIAAFIAAPKLKEQLALPQTMTVTEYNELGEPEREYEEPNPDAPAGFVRAAMETAYNILPFGAVEQAKRDAETRAFLPLYALGGFALTTAIGAAAFRKKDLK